MTGERVARADVEEVKALCDYLIHAFDAYTNDPARPHALTYLDGMMGVHNFHKAIMHDLYERQQPSDRNALLYKMAADTFTAAMTELMMSVRKHA